MNKSDIESSTYYTWPKEEHDRILEQLKANLFIAQAKSDKPRAIFVVGQPGCGKTTYINAAKDLSGYVNINSDEYRQYCKGSDEILNSSYSTYYTKLTNPDAHLWGDELFDYGIANGYPVLREKAPINSALLDTIKNLVGRCNIEVRLVATGNLRSLLATRERYEAEWISGNHRAKLSSIEAHNKCYDYLPEFISGCIALGVNVSYVVPTMNGYRIQNAGPNALTSLTEIRKASNLEACKTYAEKMLKLRKAMTERGAVQEQFEELSKIECAYSEIIAEEKSLAEEEWPNR